MTDSSSRHPFAPFLIPLSSPNFLFLFSSITLLLSYPSSSSAKLGVDTALSIIGFSPDDTKYFSGKIEFSCRDGARVHLPVSFVNDNFCDCPDGTDEPGTTACPLSHFYCANRGHMPTKIPSSQVNDGVCDCCDGTDEYRSPFTRVCNNTCIQMGASARSALKERLEKMRRGAEERDRIVNEAKGKIEGWRREEEELKREKERLEALDSELKEKKDDLERREREEREWSERLAKEQERREKIEREGRPAKQVSPDGGESDQENPGESGETTAPIAEEREREGETKREGKERIIEGSVEEHSLPPPPPSPLLASPEMEEQLNKEEDSRGDEFEGMSEDEIGRMVAARWTGGGGEGENESAKRDSGLDGEKEKEGEEDEVDEDEEYDAEEDEESEAADEEGGKEGESGEREEGGGAEEDFDVGDFEDEEGEGADSASSIQAISPKRTWFARIFQWPRDFCSKIFGLFTQPPPAIPPTEAEKIRADYEDAHKNLTRVKKRLNELKDSLSYDLGPEGQFIDFVNRCFTHNIQHYVYEICPFKKVTQKEGNSKTTVGIWKGFDPSFTVMKFEDGDGCWNGPSRKINVRLECGLVSEFKSVEEPSRCEYAAVLTTPVLCDWEKTRSLERELEQQEKEIRSLMDEIKTKEKNGGHHEL